MMVTVSVYLHLTGKGKAATLWKVFLYHIIFYHSVYLQRWMVGVLNYVFMRSGPVTHVPHLKEATVLPDDSRTLHLFQFGHPDKMYEF